MIGALWTGISGLDSHQTALDNESHNIANVNTVGYKASRISFADQMYQDKIGKGSKILDAEKLYTQGNLKLTGVSYDMALSGDGFFTVANTRSSGTAETLYTRAGNFRMGDNGTLQDAAGNEVQGWAMSAIDQAKDVTSTNPNVSVFTGDYSKLISSKIIRHSNYVETVTAKATDYTQTAKADSESVFTGAGYKTQSSKIADVEALISDYSSWLQKYKETPDGSSATSTAQVSQINFKSETDGLVKKEGDQIYVYIDGNKISQNYVTTTTTRTDLTTEDLDGDGTAGGASDQNIQASRIATYQALADKISAIPGMKATMVHETGGTNNDVLEDDEPFEESTDMLHMRDGIIQIESLIPGKQFTITEVAEVSGTTTVQGNYQTGTPASAGTGLGALESSKEALQKVLTGKQQDVYTSTDLNITATAANNDYTYGINIYDKDLGTSIPVPNNGATPPVATTISIDDVSDIDDFVTKFNTAGDASSPKLTDYVEAKNINGKLVIRTLDTNYDVEFSGSLKNNGTPIDKNNNYSGRAGAGAEFIEIVTTVDQTSSQGSQQLRLDTLGISDSAFGEFSVDATGLLTMKQDGADFAIGQVSIALFNNNRGLEPRGDNLLAKTNDSGDPIYNVNNDKTAKVEGKTLELSTADLSESLVNLMVFQRAFEANAKSITTADQLLNTLINLKRS
jgi:flagellar hook protein FlgE